MATVEDTSWLHEAAQKVLQANKDHQYALKVYTERLEAELRTIDKLLDTADVVDEDEEPELDAGGFILLPSSAKVVFPIAPNDFLLEDSPFHEDALRRNRYIGNTATHPMKTKELEVLAEAVRTENHRKRALEAQKGGLLSFATCDDSSRDFFEWNTAGIDWDRVAEKVSSVASLPRTARDCAIRWLGDRHPQFVHGPWSTTELENLQALIKNAPDGPIDWDKIANNLGNNRTPLDCMRHGIHRKQHAWTPESDDALLSAIGVYGTSNWILVASRVSEDTTPQQCQNRYNRTLDPTLHRGAWTAEEDAKLRQAVNVFGHSWIEVAEVIAGRTNEQCRDRWSDKLNPTVDWTKDDDKLLLEAVGSLGTSNWKGTSERLGNGRTDDDCRSRYEKLVQKKKKKPKASPETQIPVGPSSVPARPSPRSRTKKALAADSGVVERHKQQPVQRPRLKQRPREKKNEETIEGHSIVEGGSTVEAGAGKEKGQGKQRAKTTPSVSLRKRKSRIGDDAEDSQSTKKKKSDTT